MTSLPAVVLFTLLSCMAHVAAGQSDWASTFSPPGLSAHVEPDRRFMVLPAGPSGSADAAAKALARGLEQAGASLVMDESALGSLSGMDDAAIVVKARPYPVDLVVIVRVFAGAGSGANTLVAVAYGKDGQVAFALNGREGTKLASPKPTATDARASQGVSAAAASSVAAVTKHQALAYEERVRRYKEEFLHFGETLFLMRHGGVIPLGVPYQGQYAKVLKWPEFFTAAERKDLHDEYRRRQRSKRIMAGAGVAGFGVGWTTLGMALVRREDCFNKGPECDESASVPAVIAGSVFIVGGLAVAVAAIFRRKLTVDMSEARRIAGEHNRELRLELGLDDELKPAARELRDRSSSPRFWDSLNVGPSADRHSGGFQLSFRL